MANNIKSKFLLIKILRALITHATRIINTPMLLLYTFKKSGKIKISNPSPNIGTKFLTSFRCPFQIETYIQTFVLWLSVDLVNDQVSYELYPLLSLLFFIPFLLHICFFNQTITLVVTRRSHISTATSSTRSSYETHAKLQQKSISSTGGVASGAMVDADQQQQSHTHLKHHNHQQQHQHHHHHQHSHSHKTSSSSSRPPAPHVRTCKKTRFLLEPNRRSWSESDLLKEIDSELKLAKGFLYANGG